MATNITSLTGTTDVVRPSPSPRASVPAAATGGASTGQNANQAAQSSAASGNLDNAVQEANYYLQSINRGLEFSVDKDTDRTVVKVVDTKSGEVVRQIPSEEMLELARHMREMEKTSEGVIFKAQV